VASFYAEIVSNEMFQMHRL